MAEELPLAAATRGRQGPTAATDVANAAVALPEGLPPCRLHTGTNTRAICGRELQGQGIQ